MTGRFTRASRFAWLLPGVSLVLAGLLLGILFNQPGFCADKKILINQDNANNINVTIDPTLVPDTQITRRDKKMTIELPDASGFDANRLRLDPALTKNATVEVKKTAKGTAITIYSNQVYLNIQDTDTAAASAPSPPNKPKKIVAATATAAPVSGKKDASKKTAAAPTVAKPAPITAKPASVTAKPAPVAIKPAPKPEPKPAPVAVKPQPKPAPVTVKPPPKPTPVAIKPTPKPAPVVTQPAPKPVSVAVNPAPKPAPKPIAITPPPAPPKPIEVEEITPIATMAIEEEPVKPAPVKSEAWQQTPAQTSGDLLDFGSAAQEAAADDITTDGTIPRILASLALVLLMILVGLRIYLPELMARYPEFFEKLREQQQAKAPSGLKDQLFKNPGKNSSMTPAHDKLAGFMKQFQKPGDPSTSSGAFDILNTTDMGGGKQIHLVEIMGRQMLLASTPEGISLVTEIEETPKVSAPQSAPQQTAETEKPESDAQAPSRFETVYKKYLAPEAKPTAKPKTEAPIPPPPPRADIPKTDIPKSNPYMSVPGRVSKPKKPAFYAGPLARPATIKRNRPTPRPVAEDYIILDDFEDVYRV